MNRFTLLIALFFVATLTMLSSCKSDDEDGDTQVRKGLLTAHTWAYSRVSINGGANQVDQYSKDFHTFHADGSYTKETRMSNGSLTTMKGRWELREGGSLLRMYTDLFETVSSIRELNETSLKITRQDPDLTVEFDFVPVSGE